MRNIQLKISKNVFSFILGLFFVGNLTACTQDSVVKNTALRFAVEQFDEELSKNPNPQIIQEIKKKTQIEVTDLKMISDKEAIATVSIKSVNPKNRTEQISRLISVHLTKDSAWSVKN